MCDFSSLYETGSHAAETQARWDRELDTLAETVQAYADETDMPARLVANHEVGGLEFYSLESGNFMGVIYVPGEPGDSLSVQNAGRGPVDVPDWHTGIGELVLGYLSQVNPLAAMGLILGIEL